MSKRLSQEEVIRRFREVHGDKYGYDRVVYVDNSTPIEIYCPIHGWTTVTPANHFRSVPRCCRSKKMWDVRGRITTEDFIRRSKERFGEFLDYSKTHYTTAKEPVIVTCPFHGDVKVVPDRHLHSVYACPECEKDSRKTRPQKGHRKLIRGVGVLDIEYAQNKDEITRTAYQRWIDILQRCYKENYTVRDIKYQDCYVSEEWKLFSNFLKWFKENYVEGYAIDKDIIKKGNRCYCADYCCFVPQRINNLIENRSNHRGELPIGVHKQHKKYSAKLGGVDKYFLGTFDTPEEAFFAYKAAKETYIKQVAQEYYESGKITKRVYDALMKYEVEITD